MINSKANIHLTAEDLSKVGTVVHHAAGRNMKGKIVQAAFDHEIALEDVALAWIFKGQVGRGATPEQAAAWKAFYGDDPVGQLFWSQSIETIEENTYLVIQEDLGYKPGTKDVMWGPKVYFLIIIENVL